MEKFNENIRKKLLEIEPEFQKQDWEEMHAFMTKVSKPKIFWTKDTLIKTGLILALLSSLLFNFIEYLSTINSRISVQIIENKATNNLKTKTDTIYITKYKTKYVTVFIKPKKEVRLVNITKNEEKANDFNLKPNPTEKAESLAENTNPTLARIDNNNYKIQENLSILNENTTQNTLKFEKLEGIKYSATEWPNYLKIRNLDFSTLNQKKKKENLLVLKIPRPKLEDPNLNVGLMLDITAAKTAYGATAETAITPRLGLLTGLKYAGFTGKDYYTEKQYEALTGQNFRTIVKSNLPKTKEIINIEDRYNLIQIPLQINYRLVLPTKYKLSFGLGTDFNILSKQKIRYNFNNDNLVFEEVLFKNKNKSLLFNNVNLFLGIEKNFDKYVIHLRPYAGVYFGKANYVSEKLQAGVNLSLLRKLK
jgi:hypothetical protein